MTRTETMKLYMPDYRDPASIMDAIHYNMETIDDEIVKLQKENEGLHEELSHKADWYGGSQKGLMNGNLDNLPGNEGDFTRYRICDVTGTLPWDDLVDCVVEEYVIDAGWRHQTLFDVRSNRTAARTMIRSVWQAWDIFIYHADVETPEKFNISFSSGIVTRKDRLSEFYKSYNNIVTVNVYCEKNDNTAFQEGTAIATLPAGFRPAAIIDTISIATNENGIGATPCNLAVQKTGEIIVYQVLPTTAWGKCKAL